MGIGSLLIKKVTANRLGGRVVASFLAREKRSFRLFFNFLEKNRDAFVPMEFPEEEESKIQEMVAGLKANGISTWKGLFNSPEFLDASHSLFKQFIPVFDQRKKEANPNNNVLEDEETKLQYRYSKMELAYSPDSTDSKLLGRKRFFFKPGTKAAQMDPIAALMNSDLLKEVAKRYIGSDVKINGVLAELLSPSREGDSWHIDLLADQFKVMILLQDTTEDNGPMRYKAGTHKKRDRDINLLHHQIFRYGIHYAYPSSTLVQAMDGELVLATGLAGDTVFFDTLGIHSGTRCISGTRPALVIYFDVQTYKNQILSNFAQG